MAGRSQRHMREFTGHYDADASGQAKPQQVTTITDPDTGTTVSEDFSAFFSGYPRTYSAANLPENCTINASTGVVSGTSSAGSYASVAITVTNEYGRVTSNTFTWTVT